MGQEFFLLYFFVLFLAMLGENVPLLMLGSTLVSVANIWFSPAEMAWSSAQMLRIVFFYMVALFYGHVLGQMRHERDRADRGLAWAHELEAKVAERTAALERLYTQSLEASRLKSEFVASMSHELRTPLNIIIGYTHILQGGAQDIEQAELQRMFDGIERASRSLLQLVDSVLDLRKLDSGKMPVLAQRIPLDAFMREFRHRERMALPPSTVLTWEIAPELPVMETDRAKLTVILDNLVNNAVKFTHQGSIIVRARYAATGDRVVLAVEDTGPGIPEAELASIFEPFHRVVDASNRGTAGAGLGLTIVQRYVSLLGGEIDVVSRLGSGTTFTVSLPRRPGGTPPIGDDARRAA